MNFLSHIFSGFHPPPSLLGDLHSAFTSGATQNCEMGEGGAGFLYSESCVKTEPVTAGADARGNMSRNFVYIQPRDRLGFLSEYSDFLEQYDHWRSMS